MAEELKGSGIGEDGLGPRSGDSVDGARTDQSPVVEDLVLGSAGRRPSGAGDGLPSHDEGVPLHATFSVQDGARDDPLDSDLPGVAPTLDGDSSGVLGSIGVDAVDHISANDSGPLLKLSTGETGTRDENDRESHDSGPHGGESKEGIRPIFKVLIAVVGVFVAGVMAFAIFEPVQVLPRIGLGPGFSFIDQAGSAYTSQDGRGFVTLYAFAPTDCGPECDAIHGTVSEVGERVEDAVDLGEAEFRVVTVALDSSDPAELAAAASRAGADGDRWMWVGAEEPHRKEVVGGGFEVFYENHDGQTDFDPVFVIVDGNGLIRGEYRYATLASDADRLTRHIGLLGDEIRNADGNAALIYEAAHVFLCYP